MRTWLFTLLVSATVVRSALAQGGEPQPYTVMWDVAINSRHNSGYNWGQKENQIAFGEAPIRRDGSQMVYGVDLPRTEELNVGPHVIWADPTFMTRHRQSLRERLPTLFPDPNYAGLAIIDFEPPWPLFYELTPERFKTAFRECVNTRQPELLAGKSAAEQDAVIAGMYAAAARELLLGTLAECKLLRPHAKWCYFSYPWSIYYWRELGAWEQIGYGDHTNLASRLNDGIQWLYDAEDAIIVAPYAYYWTVPDSETADLAQFTDSIANSRRYVQTNVEEAVRVAHGKPVYCMIWLRYHGLFGQTFANRFLNGRNREIALEAPRGAGAQGVIIWDYIEWPAQYTQVRNYAASAIIPMVRQHGHHRARNMNGGVFRHDAAPFRAAPKVMVSPGQAPTQSPQPVQMVSLTMA